MSDRCGELGGFESLDIRGVYSCELSTRAGLHEFIVDEKANRLVDLKSIWRCELHSCSRHYEVDLSECRVDERNDWHQMVGRLEDEGA